MKEFVSKQVEPLTYKSAEAIPAGFWIPGNDKWFHCRDTFFPIFKSSTEGIYFSTTVQKLEESKIIISTFKIMETVPHFINRLEVLLELEEKKMSVFYPTPKPLIFFVRMSDFWKSCPARRSLYTILLRSGLKYDKQKDNFDEAMYSDPYAATTKLAVQRFLFGFVDYNQKGNPNFTGWKNCFEGVDFKKTINLLGKNGRKPEFPMCGKLAQTANIPMVWD